MKQWNLHGWDWLSGRNPEVIKARNDILQRLDRVPEPDKTNWYGRLKSKLDHPHFSTRLEIQLHDFFKERGWVVQIEPTLPEINNRPDFLLRRGVEELIVEAKTVFDPKSIAEQENRMNELAESLTGSLKRSISIHASNDLPPISLPRKIIAAEIESRAADAREDLMEFHVTGEHRGYAYDLEVVVLLDEKPSENADIGSTMALFHSSDSNDRGQRIRSEIIKKAKKYGELNVPLVVAVWPKLALYNSSLTDDFNDDSIALDGDEDWFTGWSNRWSKGRKPNGVFTFRNKFGASRYSRISAVIMYDFTYNDGPCHSYRMYHNPFANFPVGNHVFGDIPQARFSRITDSWVWES